MRGKRIDYVAPVKEKEIEDIRVKNKYKGLFYLGAIVLLVLVYILYKNARRMRELREESESYRI